jgi:hypothetical protein
VEEIQVNIDSTILKPLFLSSLPLNLILDKIWHEEQGCDGWTFWIYGAGICNKKPYHYLFGILVDNRHVSSTNEIIFYFICIISFLICIIH